MRNKKQKRIYKLRKKSVIKTKSFVFERESLISKFNASYVDYVVRSIEDHYVVACVCLKPHRALIGMGSYVDARIISRLLREINKEFKITGNKKNG